MRMHSFVSFIFNNHKSFGHISELILFSGAIEEALLIPEWVEALTEGDFAFGDQLAQLRALFCLLRIF